MIWQSATCSAQENSMYPLLKSVAAQWLMPLPISMILLCLGGLLYAWRCRRLALGAAGLATLGLLLASFGPTAERLLAPLETRYPPMQQLPAMPLDAIVILGGGWQPNAPYSAVGKLSESSALRLMEGLRLSQQASALPVVVSGASRDTQQVPIAIGYAEAAGALGVPQERLVVLAAPTDTGQEAQAVKRAFGEGARIVLVTSASHMPRAMRHFQAAGLVPMAAPTHYLSDSFATTNLAYWVPSARHLRKTERAIYEALGLMALRLEAPTH
jgi:uncharacterized SAM-binding protein YcdF (DUF218 family)